MTGRFLIAWGLTVLVGLISWALLGLFLACLVTAFAGFTIGHLYVGRGVK